MIKTESALNIIVIAISIMMIGFISLFIYSNIHLKDRITLRTVERTERLVDFIIKAARETLDNEHTTEQYANVLKFGEIIGIRDIGIYKKDGKEAFRKYRISAGPSWSAGFPIQSREIDARDKRDFAEAIESKERTHYFDHENNTYTSYVALRAVSGCIRCHYNAGHPLGVLKVTLSTESDFKLLDTVKRFNWAHGLVVSLAIAGLLVTGIILRDKNRLNKELEQGARDLRKTYNDLQETRYYQQMIIDNTKATIITADTQGKIVEFNKESEKLFGYTKDEIAGESIAGLYVNPGSWADLVETQGAGDRDSWVIRNREAEMKAKSGKRIYMSLTISALVDENGNIAGTVSIGKDISEQKMLQFKLVHSEKLAGIGTLASGIAHEINNPLAGILGMAEAALDEDDPELVRSYTTDIISYAMNAGEIVKQLSEYSRSSRNDATSTVDLAVVIENSLKMARHSESFISINLALDLERDCFINANEGEIQQVFLNLIINATHAMKDKGTLSLRLKRVGDFVRAVVEDSGDGISQEHLSQIFDPFFTTKPVGKGTGLGLFVVYRIITKYGGAVTVDSKPGQGSAFNIEFPSRKMAEAL